MSCFGKGTLLSMAPAVQWMFSNTNARFDSQSIMSPGSLASPASPASPSSRRMSRRLSHQGLMWTVTGDFAARFNARAVAVLSVFGIESTFWLGSRATLAKSNSLPMLESEAGLHIIPSTAEISVEHAANPTVAVRT